MTENKALSILGTSGCSTIRVLQNSKTREDKWGKMAQQKGFKRAQKVLVRKRKLVAKETVARARRLVRQAEVAAKEPTAQG